MSIVRITGLALALIACGTTERSGEAPVMQDEPAPGLSPPAEPGSAGTPPVEIEPVEPEPEPEPEPTIHATPLAQGSSTTAVAPAVIEPAEPGASGKSFTVEARLVDTGRRTPHCGRVHAIAVMKLEVIEVIDGRFAGDTLYIYVSCPEMLASKTIRRLEQGKTYRFVLDTRIRRRLAGAKFDAFRDVDAPRYLLLRVDEAPPR